MSSVRQPWPRRGGLLPGLRYGSVLPRENGISEEERQWKLVPSLVLFLLILALPSQRDNFSMYPMRLLGEGRIDQGLTTEKRPKFIACRLLPLDDRKGKEPI